MKDKVIVRSRFKDIANFTKIPVIRKGVFSEAPDTPLGKNFAVNSNAAFLHPTVQYLKIKEVIQVSPDTREFILEPDTARGTGLLANFRPGQYITVKFNIGQAVVTRPYTLCSSPKLTADDEYIITVKKVPHGFVSQYIFSNWQKGTVIEASAPAGTLFYQPIRDCTSIVALCDSRGVSGFLSMARAIADGTLNINLTLFYGCRKKNEAIFMDKLLELAKSTENFNVVFVFSDERVDKCERGFITKSIVEKYAPKSRFSVFICGSPALYNLASTLLQELRLERKFIRFGLSGQLINPTSLPDFPKDAIGKSFLCKVIRNGEVEQTFAASAEETLLVALEREGIEIPSGCRSGECGFCRSKLVKGNVFIPRGTDYRRLADTKYGIIHPCCSYPMSDIAIVIS